MSDIIFANKPSFLSYSAMTQLEKNPNKFYCERLREPKVAKEPQGTAAGIGTVADIEIKHKLIDQNRLGKYSSPDVARMLVKNRGMQNPWYQADKEGMTLREMDYTGLQQHNKTEEIMAKGKLIADIYEREVFDKNVFYDVDVKNTFPLRLKLKGRAVDVPLYNIADALIGSPEDEGGVDVLDFKTTGTTPKKGWYSAYSADKQRLGLWSTDESVTPDKPLNEVDYDWATQCCIYGWANGKPLFQPFVAHLDCVAYGAKTLGPRIFRYRGTLSAEFQKIVAMRCINAWDAITTPEGRKAFKARVAPTDLLAQFEAAELEKWWG